METIMIKGSLYVVNARTPNSILVQRPKGNIEYFGALYENNTVGRLVELSRN